MLGARGQGSVSILKACFSQVSGGYMHADMCLSSWVEADRLFISKPRPLALDLTHNLSSRASLQDSREVVGFLCLVCP